MIKISIPIMVVKAEESDCVVLEVIPTKTGFPLFPSAQSQQSQSYPARNTKHSCLYNYPRVKSRMTSDARHENSRMSDSSVTENTKPNSKLTFSHLNPNLLKHPWADSAEFIELGSDIPSDNINLDWTDQEKTSSENNSASISNFETDSGHDSSRRSWVLSKHPWTASKDFVELWKDIPSELDSSQNQYKDRREFTDQNNRTSVSNVVDSIYESSVISWDPSKHLWTASKEFVVLWSDVPSDKFYSSQNRSNDQGELMDQNNRISNVVVDSKYDSSVLSWDFSRHPWSKDFVVLWSDLTKEFDYSRSRTNDRGKKIDQNRTSNAVAGSKCDSSVISRDSRKHTWTKSEFVGLWSDVPSEFLESRNRSNDQGERLAQNYRASDSNIVVNSKFDASVKSWDPSKHPWLASKAFVVLWSDIPSDKFHSSQNRSNDQERMEKFFASNSSVEVGSKNDSSVLTWDPSKHLWTESKDFVNLSSDIPNEFYSSQNRSNDQGERMDQNSISNVKGDSKYNYSGLSRDLIKGPLTMSRDYVVIWSDIPSDEFDTQNQSEDENGGQQLSDHSGFFGNSCNDSESLTQVSIIARYDPESNKNYFYGREKNGTCCELFCDGCCYFENFAMQFKTSICYLVTMILLSLMPISAACMGFAHCATNTCPANVAITHLVYLAGIVGICYIGLHVWRHFAEEERKEDIGRGVRLFQVFTVIILLIEMGFFYSMSASFENSENYCDETFYNYTFYTNIAGAGIVFLSVLLEYTPLKHIVDNLQF